jgi:hypothetical protein
VGVEGSSVGPESSNLKVEGSGAGSEGSNLKLEGSKSEVEGTEGSSDAELETATLGDFAEAFVRGDTTNWFRRMKLLDHIETVQDNVQAWLDMIEDSLEGE